MKSPRYFEEERKRDIIVDAARRKKISRCSFEGEIFCGHLLTSLDFGKDYGIKKLSPLKVSKLAAHFDLIREGSFKCVDNPACVNGEIKSLIRPPSPPIFLFSSFSSFSFSRPLARKTSSLLLHSILPFLSAPREEQEREGRKRRRIKRFCHTALPPLPHTSKDLLLLLFKHQLCLHFISNGGNRSSPLVSLQAAGVKIRQCSTHTVLYIFPEQFCMEGQEIPPRMMIVLGRSLFSPALFLFSFFLGGRGDGGGPERRRRRNILSSLPLFFSPSRIRRRRRPPPP